MGHATVGLVLGVIVDKEQGFVRREIANVVEAVARLIGDSIEVSLIVVLSEDLCRGLATFDVARIEESERPLLYWFADWTPYVDNSPPLAEPMLCFLVAKMCPEVNFCGYGIIVHVEIGHRLLMKLFKS